MKKYTYSGIYGGTGVYRKGRANKRKQVLSFNWQGVDMTGTWYRGKPVFREDITTNVYVPSEYEDSDCEVFVVLKRAEYKDLRDTYEELFDKAIIGDIKFSYDDEKFILLDNGETIKHIATGTLYKSSDK